MVRDAREVFFASIPEPVEDEILARGGFIEVVEGLFVIDLRGAVSVGECCASCLAADAAVGAVAAAGSLAGLVGDLGRTVLGDFGSFGEVDVGSFFMDWLLCFACRLNLGGGAIACGLFVFADLCSAASLASCARLAESMTPLIFAGPPLICAIGEVGVFGDGLEVRGDLEAGFDFALDAGLVTICFTGGNLADCVVFVDCTLFGAGPDFFPLL